MKSILKYTAISLAVIGVLLTGGIYYASQKISADDIKKWTVEGIEKAMPNSKASVGKVNISPGLSFSIELIDFEMSLKKQGKFPDKKLIKLSQAVVKIPIWAVISGRGSISLNVDKPDLYVSERSSLMNWTHAMGDKNTATETKKSNEKNKESDNSNVQDIMRGNSLDLILTDTSINYDLNKTDRGNFILSKFLIKNLSFKKATAFEIASKLNMKMKAKGNLNLELLSVGQVNLSDYFDKKKVSGLINVDIKKINLPDLKKEIKSAKTELKFDMQGNNLTGSLKTTVDSFLNLESAFSKNSNAIQLSKIKGDIDISDVINYVEAPKDMSITSGKVSFSGMVNKKSGRINPEMTFKSVKDFAVKLSSGQKLISSLEGTYKNYLLNVNTKNKGFNGEIEARVGLTYNPNKEFKLTDIGPVRSLIWVKNVDLKEKFIQKTLYGKTKESEEKTKSKASTNSTATATNTKNPPINLPMVNVVLKWSEVRLGKENFAGAFRWKGRGKGLICKGCEFQFSKGKGSFDHNVDLTDSNNIKISFKSFLNNLNMSSLKPFLPPALSKIDGNLKGDVLGTASTKGAYNVQVKVAASNGEIKGNKLGGYIKDLVGNVPVLSKAIASKSINLSDKFKTISFVGNLKNDHYDLKSFKYIGHSADADVSVNGSGNLYPLNKSKRGVVDMNIVDKTGKLIKNLKKHIGSDTLPMRLNGYGLDLKPDYGYTIKKVSKGAIKTQGKKHLKKAVDKLLKKDKLKKVFKGLFK